MSAILGYVINKTRNSHDHLHAPVQQPFPPKRVLCYESSPTIYLQVERLLDAYPQDKCIIFDGLDSDSLWHERDHRLTRCNVSKLGITHVFERYEMITVVYNAMAKRYGPAWP